MYVCRLHAAAAAAAAACRGSIAEVATKNQSGKSYSISGTIAPVRTCTLWYTTGTTCLLHYMSLRSGQRMTAAM
jgi:hypothetical protein